MREGKRARNREKYRKKELFFIPTYPGVPQAVDITVPESSILDSPKSLIMMLESSSML